MDVKRKAVEEKKSARAISCAAAQSPTLPLPPVSHDQLCVRAGLRHHTAAYFGVFLIVMLLRPDPAAHQVISDCVAQSEVVISFGSHISILHQGEVEVPVEISFQVCNVFHPGQAPD